MENKELLLEKIKESDFFRIGYYPEENDNIIVKDIWAVQHLRKPNNVELKIIQEKIFKMETFKLVIPNEPSFLQYVDYCRSKKHLFLRELSISYSDDKDTLVLTDKTADGYIELSGTADDFIKDACIQLYTNNFYDINKFWSLIISGHGYAFPIFEICLRKYYTGLFFTENEWDYYKQYFVNDKVNIYSNIWEGYLTDTLRKELEVYCLENPNKVLELYKNNKCIYYQCREDDYSCSRNDNGEFY